MLEAVGHIILGGVIYMGGWLAGWYTRGREDKL